MKFITYFGLLIALSICTVAMMKHWDDVAFGGWFVAFVAYCGWGITWVAFYKCTKE